MKTYILLCFFVSLATFASKSSYYPDGILNESDRYLREELSNLLYKTHRYMSYTKAKIKMFGDIDLERDSKGYYVYDVYCQTRVRKNVGPGKIPNNKIMNTEHLWPQDLFVYGAGSSGQKSDLHHLLPTASRANSCRGTYPFGEVGTMEGLYGGCSSSKRGYLEPDYNDSRRFFEPPDEVKGNIARALFYFAVRYDARIDEVQEFFLRLWHEIDPVDDSERSRHEKIFAAQKNRNPFIDYPNLVDEIRDF